MNSKRSRRALALLTTGVLAVTLAACGGDDGGASGDEDGTYKWGINAELSGVTAYYGEGMQAGIEAYVEEVNAAGGIDGHEIELVALDNAGDASRTATNATQLATAEEVNAMFGFVLSANCSAATPVAERYQVPLACMSLAEENDYAFSLGADNTRGATAMLEAAKEVTGNDAPSVALVNINTLTSIGFGDNAEEAAGDLGVEIATRQEIDIAASDPSTQVARIVDADPDAVLISHTGPGFLGVLKGVRNAGVDAPFIWLDGTGNLPSLAESTDKNVYALTTYEIVDPAAAEGAAAEFVAASEGPHRGRGHPHPQRRLQRAGVHDRPALRRGDGRVRLPLLGRAAARAAHPDHARAAEPRIGVRLRRRRPLPLPELVPLPDRRPGRGERRVLPQRLTAGSVAPDGRSRRDDARRGRPLHVKGACRCLRYGWPSPSTPAPTSVGSATSPPPTKRPVSTSSPSPRRTAPTP
ncbi:ABC transporter substrate-binding protein [Nocardioides sp. TF02-7]|uniref:ABC transporter substrate-binding protein n=1 Tax=Nocardioides sp. TF02-7 TaxID=2917724 RepID=UPI001F0516C8|nr:ABC transporter substrate-binding protein [Nocardioides sp. TF02-7]UMG91305.1 ABC transporter substrate-binding protein [Nocardioides sp. TF02-7]